MVILLYYIGGRYLLTGEKNVPVVLVEGDSIDTTIPVCAAQTCLAELTHDRAYDTLLLAVALFRRFCVFC